MEKRKLLLIGWDAADWKIINKLIAKGQMPAFQKFIQEGSYGNISTLDPPFSPMLWTTIATGVYPDKHGVLGFTEPLPNNSGIRPISSNSRTSKALWNILSYKKLKTNVVSWWPSNPVEPINGIMVSNLYNKIETSRENWRMPPNTVHPKNLTPLFQYLRVHPSELTEEHLLPFVPNAKAVDQDNDKRLYSVAKLLSEAATVHSATTWIMDNTEWDFTAVYLDSIDHFCHGFMNYHPPKMSVVNDTDFDLYKNVIESAYRFHDMMLEELIELAGDDTTIMLLSDHGFHSDHLRPNMLPDEPAGPASQHRDFGVFCVKGPGIKKNNRIFGASLIDITPTVLSLFDLPIGQDMNGKVLINIYENEQKINFIPSWEDIKSDDFATLNIEQTKSEDSFATQEALKQLIELGYIEDPGDDAQKAHEISIREQKYNLSRVYLSTQRFTKAIPILEKLCSKYETETRFALRLMSCYSEIGEQEKALKLADNQNEIVVSEIEKYTKEFDEFRDKKDLSDDEQSNKARLYLKLKDTQKDIYRLGLLKTDFLIKQNNFKEALKIIRQIENDLPVQLSVLYKLGDIYIGLEEYSKAKEIYDKILSIDASNHIAFNGLTIVFLRTKKYEEAVESALNAIELIHHYPKAHYHLGEALFSLNMFEQAADAFEATLKMVPNFGKARNYLIDIYENKAIDEKLAKEHKDFFANKFKISNSNILKANSESKKDDKAKAKISDYDFKEPIIIVSGLPRSGTSMMMQMLKNAGLNIYTDGKRASDESNPKGYFEHENVKRLAHDKKWLINAKNSVVKIISHLLVHLPENFNYKIIFMERDINEVINSQQSMLIRLGKTKTDVYPGGLYMTFKNNVEKIKNWVKTHHNVDALYVNHIDVINNPQKEAERVKKFLNIDVDIESMISVVDKSLHRSKKKTNEPK